MTHPSIALTHPRCEQWGHKFKARFDRLPPGPAYLEHLKGTTDAFEKMCKRIYIRDVCTRCGRTIERDETCQR